MLGAKRSAGSVRSAAANQLPSSQRGLPSVATSAASGRVNSRIAVFADPDGTASTAPSSGSGSSAPWLDIGSDLGRRKENIRDASTWRGQTLEQRRVPPPHPQPQTAAAAERLEVYCDNNPDAVPVGSEGAGSVLSAKPAAGVASFSSSSSLLQSFDNSSAKVRGKQPTVSKPRVERMVMPDSILFPAGDGIPQCAEEARAQLLRYRFDYESSQIAATRRMAAGMSGSPTINTRAAEQGMLNLWNDDNSDSDSESLLGENASNKDRRHDGSGGGALNDSDYQFTMGPVVPNIIPEELAMRPPVIPTSARVVRQQEPGAYGVAGGEDDMPTVVLNSIRTAKRQQMRMTEAGGSGLRGGPTPLAMRMQATRQPHDLMLRSIGEENE
ncbi:hypothetical protein IWW38_004659, partial [Coemansia aciculifera]